MHERRRLDARLRPFLIGVNLSDANLRGAFLSVAHLSGANLSEANLSGANLQSATLVNTNLTGADLTGCCIYGVSAWDLKLERAKQHNLVIARDDEPTITVDNIEVAQFIYLMLHNQKIRHVIDTITSKAVLILGRFTDERKAVLDALRRNCASVTTFRSCSTSRFRPRGTCSARISRHPNRADMTPRIVDHIVALRPALTGTHIGCEIAREKCRVSLILKKRLPPVKKHLWSLFCVPHGWFNVLRDQRTRSRPLPSSVRASSCPKIDSASRNSSPR